MTRLVARDRARVQARRSSLRHGLRLRRNRDEVLARDYKAKVTARRITSQRQYNFAEIQELRSGGSRFLPRSIDAPR